MDYRLKIALDELGGFLKYVFGRLAEEVLGWGIILAKCFAILFIVYLFQFLLGLSR